MGRNPEFSVNGLQQLNGIESRIKNKGRFGIAVQTVQKCPTQCGLTRSHLAGDGYETVTLSGGVTQMGIGLFMAFA
jgi:hypothetical protein